MGYRDREWCAARCKTLDCDRNVTPEVSAAAERWWGKPGAPFQMRNMAGGCPDYDPEEGQA